MLQDSPENIAKRLIDTDDDDNVIENLERDLKTDIKDMEHTVIAWIGARTVKSC